LGEDPVVGHIPPLRLTPRVPGSPSAGLSDPGAVQNTLLQLASQIAGAVFTAGLTLYLVRALGASGFGVYSIAVSIGGLVVFPAGMGLPWAIGRFLADFIEDRSQLRAIVLLGLRLQIVAATVSALALLALSAPLASVFGHPGLVWPLRWIALSIVGQALFVFLISAVTSVRRVAIGLWMSIIESATETSAAVVLVVAGAGAAGATLGKAVGYLVAAVAGLVLTFRLLGRGRGHTAARVQVGVRRIVRYAGAMFIVDVTWSAISQVDVLLIGALLSSAAVGSFSAVVRILTVLGYLGIAVSSGVAPRLTLRGGAPDTRTFALAIRYLIILQGLVVAPMLVWAAPIVHLLLPSGYHSATDIMRVLTVQTFVYAPAALISVAVTYMGEARRRVPIVLGTLVIGLISTYVLIRTVGVVGAAIGDDLVGVAYVAAHLWICSSLIELDWRRLAACVVRTLAGAAVMALALALAARGSGVLTVYQWLAGIVGGTAAYVGVLMATREVTMDELTAVARRLRPR
jgi:O-antigen/teichoic acid export membrane protein